MELVLLGDIQNGYASNWARIANTEGVDKIQIGDRFREQGFGQGAEELEVAGLDISPVGGASRLFFNRAANATQPEVHRLGAVLLPVAVIPAQVERNLASTTTAIAVTNQPTNGSAPADATLLEDPPESLVPLTRRRGRPKGSKNKLHKEVRFPTGF